MIPNSHSDVGLIRVNELTEHHSSMGYFVTEEVTRSTHTVGKSRCKAFNVFMTTLEVRELTHLGDDVF